MADDPGIHVGASPPDGPWPPPSGPPPPFAPVAVSRLPAPIVGRARFATIAIAVQMLVTLLGTYATWADRRLLVRLRDGAVPTERELDRLDDLVGLSAVGFLLTLLASGVAFLMWFHRAHRNVSTWHYVKHRVGWAVGSWFVPFLNLWRPLKIAEEIIVASPLPVRTEPPARFRLWWAALFLSEGVERFATNTSGETVSGLITRSTASLVGDLLWLTAGVSAIGLIRSVSHAQQARMAPTT